MRSHRSIQAHTMGIALLLLLATKATVQADDPSPTATALQGPGGQTVAIAAPRGGAAVIVFSSAECPISNAYSPTLNALVSAFPADRLRLVGAYIDPDLTSTRLTAHAREYALKFPVALDRRGKLARQLGAVVTPEAFVLDDAGKVRYHGRIDDQFAGRGVRNANADSRELHNAIAAVLAGQPVAQAHVAAVGCPLPEVPLAAATLPTYARDVAPILQRHCQECHRPGNLGPFPLLSYEQARKRAAALAFEAEDRRMPPWKAAPGFGPGFQHDRSLSQAEIDILAAWAEAGAPEGNAADLPQPRSFPDGWTLGQPDLIVTMPDAYAIPAAGDDLYRCVVIRNPLPEDVEIVGIEYRPGNPRVVHHIIGYVDGSGEGRKRADDEARRNGRQPLPDGESYTCFGGPMLRQLRGELGGWAPGANPGFLPDGVGRILPKGSDIILQVHYHPSGKPETDQSAVALYFAPKDKPIRRAFHWWAAGNLRFTIPPGAAHHEVKGETLPLPVAVQVLTVSPHMHLLGRDMTMEAVLPDRTVVPLIRIDDWDFNWQLQYTLAKPVDLPKGSIVRVVAHYDNSADNPHNPNRDQPKPVRYGEATTDEMCFGFFGIVKNEQDLTRQGEQDDLLETLEHQERQEFEKQRAKAKRDAAER